MPDAATEGYGNGHDFKTSHMASFEKNPLKEPKAVSIFPALYASSAVRPDGYKCR